MKAWQKGYEIEELEHWVEKFKNFNKYNHNPFLQVKKFFLVSALERGEIYEENNVVYMMRTAKASSKVNMFNAGPVIAKTQKGDTIISKIAANTKEFFDVVPVLDKIKAPAWLHLFEENKLIKDAAVSAGFKKIGTRYDTYSNVIGIYFKGERNFEPVIDTENINMKKTTLSFVLHFCYDFHPVLL